MKGHLLISRPFHEKDKRLGQPSAYKTPYFLPNQLTFTYFGKGSLLFLDGTGKLTAVAT
ncbi:hypothetical protein H7U05_29740 [Priestia megaterium]|uniref:hypothetical protein n=1 Tax=Priestia megaterium TaxID=1404 RepID=UPI001C8DBA8A|nr:hypothetical protein [Priestia megaterium]MBY0201406.1 hypothetical protein [Priestia megaterium]